ncbi:hypothetical protein INT45_001550 [Circinella minor]|uniref:Heterokaryon incompatibility domain-containing protein n=1 Tax=Circinella minor TaxID=1195481 RepID=A0A8H7RXH0_9FUNG|nr:hypothetical protein INT45_001550 [Circinella minor]
MYTTYCRNQKSVDLEDRTSYRLGVTGGEYRPTWLVRVSDWQKVPGKEAVHGYHTISYCWEQSGEIVKNKTDGNDEYNVVDNGKHCIVEGYKLYEDDIIRPADDIYVAENNNQDCEKGDERKNSQVISDADDHKESNNHYEYVLRCEPKSKTTSIQYVTYDQLLQQVCKDFQVEYVWYDKVCIDQSDKEAKSNEIKQMHKIYSNARYTVAMVPEGLVYDLEDFNYKEFSHGHKAQYYFINDVWNSCWFKRSWTLEEIMMSRRILIVGTNTTMFQHSLHSSEIPTTIESLSDPLLDFGGAGQNKGSVNQALAFAHFRTSTKPHDMIYALKNTFSYMFDDMEVSYSADIKTVFNDFYRHVATDDLSILCFGSNRRLDGNINLKSTINNYNLPSWTGIAGIHAQNRVISTAHPQLIYYIDDIMRMSITTSRYWKISITSYDYGCYSLSRNNVHGNDSIMKKSDCINSARHHGNWTDMSTADKNAVLLEWFLNTQSLASAFMTHYHERRDGLLTQIRPLTLTEDCKECIVLPILLELYVPVHIQSGDNVSNFLISNYERRYCLPVLHECSEGIGRYKAVGIYYLGDHNHFEPAFKWNHAIGRKDINTDASVEIINVIFENDSHDVPKEFIIE